MMNTRFSTVLQIVASVAVNQQAGTRSTSESLAGATRTNASFIRKLLVPLRKADILAVSAGYGGGITLSRPPENIFLSEIFTATAPERKIWETRDNIPCVCFVSRNISALSAELEDEAEERVISHLSTVSLRDAIEKLRELDVASR
jgi:Rrf2 family transcriptional repressor of oqxAB